MASLEVTKKVNYVGVWLEDIFADELIQNVAGYAKAVKGKKVKLTLNSSGLRLTRNKWFQDNVTEFYPISIMRALMRNPRSASCVMFVLADPVKKYKIIALRCGSEADAIHLNNMFQQIQRDQKTSNVEMKKRDNGNWTLRGRSAHNANRHLTEIFKERNQQQQLQQQQQQNKQSPRQPNGKAVVYNGNTAYVPILDKSKVIKSSNTGVVSHTSYVKRNAAPPTPTSATTFTTTTINNNNNNINDISKIDVIIKDDDDYVIETEVEPQPYRTKPSNGVRHYSTTTDHNKHATEAEVAAFKDDIENLAEEVKDIKTILQTMQVTDSVDGSRLGNYSPRKTTIPMTAAAATTNTRYYNNNGHTAALPSRPIIYGSSYDKRVTQSADFQPTLLRGPPKQYEAKLVSSRTYQRDPWAPHNRVSGSFILPSKHDYRYYPTTDSGRSSLRVKFDTESIKSTTSSKRSKKLRLPSDYSMSTTVVKPIENAYGRPVVLRRNSTSHVVAMRPRPASYHAMGTNELKIYRAPDSYMDVAL